MDDAPFRQTAQRVLSNLREVESVATIEIVVSRFERERRCVITSYEDYLLATGRSVGVGVIAPADRHWFELWQMVRREIGG